jgi:hypothetical protein
MASCAWSPAARNQGATKWLNVSIVFKRFERFWHWSQAALIIFLMLTAFDIHGTYTIFGFEKAVAYHTIAAWTLIGPLGVCDLLALSPPANGSQYIRPRTQKVARDGELLPVRASSRTRRIRSS